MKQLIVLLIISSLSGGILHIAATVVGDSLVELIKKNNPDTFEKLSENGLKIKIKSAIIKAAELLDLHHFEDAECEPDFSRLCPEGWAHAGDGKTCLASSGYDGTCDQQLDMSNRTPLDKWNFSNNCGLSWPCRKRGDFVVQSTTRCPKYWQFNGTECIAPNFYAGTCELRMELNELTMEKRSELSRMCDVEWDTNILDIDNLIDWDAKCPFGYKDVEGTCIIQDGYISSAPNKLIFNNKKEKMKIAADYNLTWYASINRQLEEEEAQGWPFKMTVLDSPAKCPVGWELDRDYCLAPATYKGPCELRVNFSNYSTEAKAIWSVICGADFTRSNNRVEQSNSTNDIVYKNGPIEPTMKIVKRKKSTAKPSITLMNKQLHELLELRKATNDEYFSSTLEYSIRRLEDRIRGRGAVGFLQIKSQRGCTRDDGKCPHNWDDNGGVCVAPSSYRKLMSNCFNIIRGEEGIQDECKVPFPCKTCDEDFVTQPCPRGWKRDRYLDGELIRTNCKAPKHDLDYRSIECGNSVDFTNVAPIFKRNWAFICNTRFPCFNEEHNVKCVQNYYRKCPYDWSLDGVVCRAPDYYRGSCDRNIDTSKISTPEDKKQFSIKCDAPWPCTENCVKDYTSPCPENWQYQDGKCISSEYKGPCSNSITPPDSDLGKLELEFKCKAYWRCTDE